MKYRLNNCPLRTRADLGQVRAPANHCFHCIQDDGFACAGLPGHRGKTRLEDQLQAVNDGKVFNTKFGYHRI